MKSLFVLLLTISLVFCASHRSQLKVSTKHNIRQVCQFIDGLLLRTEEDRAQYLDKIFDSYDDNHDGVISQQEIQDHVPDFNIREYWTKVDQNKDGEITRWEYNHPNLDAQEVIRGYRKENCAFRDRELSRCEQ